MKTLLSPKIEAGVIKKCTSSPSPRKTDSVSTTPVVTNWKAKKLAAATRTSISGKGLLGIIKGFFVMDEVVPVTKALGFINFLRKMVAEAKNKYLSVMFLKYAD